MRLLEYLQKTNGVSRRTLTKFIDEGKIFVNRKKVESYTTEIQEGDEIKIQGKTDEGKAKLKSLDKPASLMLLNKPKGYVVSKADPHCQTIYKLLPFEYHKRYYIGRLDKESHGLLLLTDDPKLVHEYSHPSAGIQKEYLVELDRQLGPKAKEECILWVKEEGEILKAIKVIHNKSKRGKWFYYNVILQEGKNRHIRRMFKKLGYNVMDLQRIREGKYVLGDLRSGKMKLVKIQEDQSDLNNQKKR